GAHNDGAAGDLLYGSPALTMNAASMQCYVYAENADAGIFSPARAEHEFYTLNANIQTANAGEVVINEFLAVNQNDTVDENGAHEDWIELYNATPNPLNLFGLYLSDTYTNLAKFSFPENSVIQPNGYLMIWADEDNTTTGDLHCNFKLSSNGESLLLSNAAGNILDSISFGTQIADHSIARCPNATGPFLVTTTPTFKQSNICTDGIDELKSDFLFLFPNPVSDILNIVSKNSNESKFEIFNALGVKVFEGKYSLDTRVYVGNLMPGFYVFSTGIVKKKFLIGN
ncbi:MAG: lamin tail domain-containing protein, partial [Bacteroidetes bacterium]|nr:lamin tail domain-containing protein [Bacteroidota bacterium]